MKVIAKNAEAQDVNLEPAGKTFHAFLDPSPSVVEALSRGGVATAEEGATYTAAVAVVDAWNVFVDLICTGNSSHSSNPL